MNLELDGKRVLITGASKGIGYACAEAFAAEGARVAMVSRSQANLDAALARLQRTDQEDYLRAARSGALDTEALGAARRAHAPIAFAADMTRAEEAERMVAEVESSLGAIDVLVNSAGAARRYAPADLDARAWHDAMDAKFFSTIHAVDAVLRRMLPRKRGVIVNIIGMGGKVASPVHMPGGAANAALMLATAGLAAAYGPSGIRVNGINPGGTLTGRVQEGLKAEAKLTGLSEQELLARNQARIPIGRFAMPEEVARLAVFLASGAAAYVTGAIVSMDGGAAAVI